MTEKSVTDRQMDRQTERQTDRRTDDGKVIPMCPLPTAGDTKRKAAKMVSINKMQVNTHKDQ